MTNYFIHYFTHDSKQLCAGPYTLDEALKKKQEVQKTDSVSNVCIEEAEKIAA